MTEQEIIDWKDKNLKVFYDLLRFKNVLWLRYYVERKNENHRNYTIVLRPKFIVDLARLRLTKNENLEELIKEQCVGISDNSIEYIIRQYIEYREKLCKESELYGAYIYGYSEIDNYIDNINSCKNNEFNIDLSEDEKFIKEIQQQLKVKKDEIYQKINCLNDMEIERNTRDIIYSDCLEYLNNHRIHYPFEPNMLDLPEYIETKGTWVNKRFHEHFTNERMKEIDEIKKFKKIRRQEWDRGCLYSEYVRDYFNITLTCPSNVQNWEAKSLEEIKYLHSKTSSGKIVKSEVVSNINKAIKLLEKSKYEFENTITDMNGVILEKNVEYSLKEIEDNFLAIRNCIKTIDDMNRYYGI